MVIGKLKPGMTVYDVRPSKGLQRFNGRWSVYPVRIIDVDTENKKVFASWNNNKPEWCAEYTWKKWRISKPKD